MAMTSLLPVANGVVGIALATPAPIMVLTRKAGAINFFIENLRLHELNERGSASAAGEGDAGADFGDGLIDQSQSAFAVAALVRRRRRQRSAG
jgi:hypothetical protein